MSRVQLSINVGDLDTAVEAAQTRLADVGLAPVPEPDARCCYALQDKIWLHDPDQLPWEFYTVREHIETP
jgi:hypothetical protein